MAYPGTIDSFTTKQDSIDDILAAHINAVQASLVAVETELGTGLHGSLADLATRLAVSLNNDGTLKSGSFTPATGSITHAMLAANAVQNDVILAGTITGASIAAATLTGANLAASTVATGNIAALAITAALIAAGAVGAAQLASPGVYPDNIGITVWNATGSTLTAGQLVYVSGYNAANALPQASLAANNVANASAVYIVPLNIANGASGVVKAHWTSGTNLNTGGSTVGNAVYLDSTAGGWTLAAPAVTNATGARQRIVGRVKVVDAAVGQIEFDLISNGLAVWGKNDLPTDAAYSSIDNAFTLGQTITALSTARCLTLNADTGATIFIQPKAGTLYSNYKVNGAFQVATDVGQTNVVSYGIQNLGTGNVCLFIDANDKVTIGSTNVSGGAVLGASTGKAALFGGTPVVKQTGASAAGIAAITDASAKAAITALQNALANLNAITAPA